MQRLSSKSPTQNATFRQSTQCEAVLRHGTRRQRNRCGVALSEMAVCLPLFVIVVFGGIETADLVFLAETLKSASYEGARAGAKWNSTNNDITVRVNKLLSARHTTGTTLTIELPNGATDVSQLNRGDIFKITITAPASSHTVGPLKMFANKTVTGQTQMVRE